MVMNTKDQADFTLNLVQIKNIVHVTSQEISVQVSELYR